MSSPVHEAQLSQKGRVRLRVIAKSLEVTQCRSKWHLSERHVLISRPTPLKLQGGSNYNTPLDKMQFLDNRVKFLYPNFFVYMGEICYSSEV